MLELRFEENVPLLVSVLNKFLQHRPVWLETMYPRILAEALVFLLEKENGGGKGKTLRIFIFEPAVSVRLVKSRDDLFAQPGVLGNHPLVGDHCVRDRKDTGILKV